MEKNKGILHHELNMTNEYNFASHVILEEGEETFLLDGIADKCKQRRIAVKYTKPKGRDVLGEVIATYLVLGLNNEWYSKQCHSVVFPNEQPFIYPEGLVGIFTNYKQYLDTQCLRDLLVSKDKELVQIRTQNMYLWEEVQNNNKFNKMA